MSRCLTRRDSSEIFFCENRIEVSYETSFFPVQLFKRGKYEFVDPAFELWFNKQFFNISFFLESKLVNESNKTFYIRHLKIAKSGREKYIWFMKEDIKNIDLVEIELRMFVDSLRPPEDIRHKVDVGYTYKNSVFELFEIRPMYGKPEKIIRPAVAKARYIKSQQVWKLYWMRASLKWELYEERGATHKKLSTVLDMIRIDKFGAFLG